MTKTEYLAQLENKLRVLPKSDLSDALEYYEGYLSDAEDEGAAIAQLGSPGEAAAQILANYVAKKPVTRPDSHAPKKHGMKTALGIILAIFALPVGLPLVMGLASVAFALILTLFILIGAFGITGGALLIAGAVYLVALPFIIAQDFAMSVLMAGSSLLSIGTGILMIKLTILLARGGFHIIARFVGKTILRRKS